MRLGMLWGMCALAGAALNAGTLISTVGSPNGGVWVNGFTGGTPALFAADSAGEPAPFDTYKGGDFDFIDGGVNFSQNWSHTFNDAVFGPTPVILGAMIELGLYDHDSSGAGDQVLSFTINGFNLTADLNTLLNTSGGGEAEFHIYSMTLSGAALLNSLATSPALIALTLQNGQVVFFGDVDPSPVEANGAGLDYSRLTIDYQDPVVEPPTGQVPEPSTAALMAGGLALLGLARRRR